MPLDNSYVDPGNSALDDLVRKANSAPQQIASISKDAVPTSGPSISPPQENQIQNVPATDLIEGTKYQVNAGLADRVNRLISEAPPEIQDQLRQSITSGYRTREQQEKAYNNYLHGGGLAARPGFSQHEKSGGMAVDWNGVAAHPQAAQYLLSNAGKYGLGFPLGARDPWHMQEANPEKNVDAGPTPEMSLLAGWSNEDKQQYEAGIKKSNDIAERYQKIADAAPPGSAERSEALREARTALAKAQSDFNNLVKVPPIYKPTDPMQNFGSIAVVLGLLGGLSARGGFTAALNAAGTAMEAQNTKNYDQYKIAMDQWKTNTDMALTNVKLASEQIRDIINDQKLGYDEKQIALNAVNDEYGMAHNTVEDAEKHNETRLRLTEQAEVAKQRILMQRLMFENKGYAFLNDPTKKDAAGNPTPYMMIPGRPETAQTLTGEPYKPGGVQKVGTAVQAAPDQQSVAATAQMIANYHYPPLSGWALRTPWGQSVLTKIKEINPQYDATEYAARQTGHRAITSGRQGDAIRSLSVSIDHLAVAEDLGKELENHDAQLLNKVKAGMEAQFGSELPVNFNTAKEIVGDEVTKAVLGGVGSVTDREALKENFSTASSPEQLVGVIHTLKRLMAGQLSGFRRQFQDVVSPEQFDKMVSPQAKQELGALGGGASSSSYASPDDVFKAIDSGTLSTEDGKKLLIDKFGYKPQ